MEEKEERAFGIIALRKRKEVFETLLVWHQKGHWGFPKGHPHKGETPEETAVRELAEEVGAKVIRFLSLPYLEEEYSYREGNYKIHKKNRYFFAEVALEDSSQMEKAEIREFGWFSFAEAEKRITFEESKILARKASVILENL